VRNKQTVWKFIVAGVAPLVFCIAFCIYKGQSIMSLYLPYSTNSDEAMYYRLVDGIVHYGAPIGYCGYNESHAALLSFSVWNPFNMIVWSIWGKIFGWNYYSPFICNMVFMAVALIVLVACVKPSWVNLLVFLALIGACAPLIRYIFSCTPETISHSFVIIFLSLYYSEYKNSSVKKRVLMYFIAFFISMMRPYNMVFSLFPIVATARIKLKKGIAVGSLFLISTASVSTLMSKLLASPYFYSSYQTGFLEAFHSGIGSGVNAIWVKIIDQLSVIRWRIALAVKYHGDTQGAIYCMIFIAIIVLLVNCLYDVIWYVRHKNDASTENVNDDKTGQILLLLSLILMLLAIMLVYQLMEGSRHLLTFLVAFFVLIAFRPGYKNAGNYFINSAIIFFAALFLFWIHYDETTGYVVPYRDSGSINVRYLENVFNERMDINLPMGYANTLDWVVEDTVEGNSETYFLEPLFAMPTGIGLNVCLAPYMEENIDNLRSRYLLTPINGSIDYLCQEKQFHELIRENGFVLYQIW
jgi:hypothetical protein